MLFSGKENVFMCLVAFQKNFRKIFSDVWLYSWKYYRKHIFYLLLTFSQLPNKYIMSFIPKNSNKTQDSIFSRWNRDRDRDRNLADFDDHDRRDRDRDRRRSAQFRWPARSRLWCIGVDHSVSCNVCGSEQWRLDRGSACVRDSCVWERGGNNLKWK